MTADCYSAVVRLVLRRRRDQRHPDLAEIEAYVVRELDATARERARDHVALCESCADFVLCLTELRQRPRKQGLPDLGAAEILAAWQSVQTRLKAEG